MSSVVYAYNNDKMKEGIEHFSMASSYVCCHSNFEWLREYFKSNAPALIPLVDSITEESDELLQKIIDYSQKLSWAKCQLENFEKNGYFNSCINDYLS